MDYTLGMQTPNGRSSDDQRAWALSKKWYELPQMRAFLAVAIGIGITLLCWYVG